MIIPTREEKMTGYEILSLPFLNIHIEEDKINIQKYIIWSQTVKSRQYEHNQRGKTRCLTRAK